MHRIQKAFLSVWVWVYRLYRYVSVCLRLIIFISSQCFSNFWTISKVVWTYVTYVLCRALLYMHFHYPNEEFFSRSLTRKKRRQKTTNNNGVCLFYYLLAFMQLPAAKTYLFANGFPIQMPEFFTIRSLISEKPRTSI